MKVCEELVYKQGYVRDNKQLAAIGLIRIVCAIFKRVFLKLAPTFKTSGLNSEMTIKAYIYKTGLDKMGIAYL